MLLLNEMEQIKSLALRANDACFNDQEQAFLRTVGDRVALFGASTTIPEEQRVELNRLAACGQSEDVAAAPVEQIAHAESVDPVLEE